MSSLRPLKLLRLKRARSAYAHPDEDGDLSMTADCVIETHREPTVSPIGIFDERGEMLCRITIPVKVPMGFRIPSQGGGDERAEMIIPANMIVVDDEAEQATFVDLAEIEGDEE